MDTMGEYNNFVRSIVAALNAAKVSPAPMPLVGAIMVVIGNEEEAAPVGGAINYDPVKGVWEADVEMQQSVPC